VAVALLGQILLQSVEVYRKRFIVQTEERVESLYLGVSPQRLWLLSLLAAAGGALLLGVVANFAPVLVIAGAVGGFMVPRFYLGAMEQQRRKQFDAQLLDALPMMAGAMKAGMSLRPRPAGEPGRQADYPGPPRPEEPHRFGGPGHYRECNQHLAGDRRSVVRLAGENG
jgi:hypothetical protein